jgi:hypothetical protein
MASFGISFITIYLIRNLLQLLPIEIKIDFFILKMNFKAIALIIFCSFICASSQEGISQHVVNGEDARIEDYPYMAHIFTTRLPTCGGAILTPRSVLSVRNSLLIFE